VYDFTRSKQNERKFHTYRFIYISDHRSKTEHRLNLKYIRDIGRFEIPTCDFRNNGEKHP